MLIIVPHRHIVQTDRRTIFNAISLLSAHFKTNSTRSVAVWMHFVQRYLLWSVMCNAYVEHVMLCFGLGLTTNIGPWP